MYKCAYLIKRMRVTTNSNKNQSTCRKRQKCIKASYDLDLRNTEQEGMQIKHSNVVFSNTHMEHTHAQSGHHGNHSLEVSARLRYKGEIMKMDSVTYMCFGVACKCDKERKKSFGKQLLCREERERERERKREREREREMRLKREGHTLIRRGEVRLLVSKFLVEIVGTLL